LYDDSCTYEYEVQFYVTLNGSGQLVVSVNGIEIPATVVGINGGGELVGFTLVYVSTPNASLSIDYPLGNVGSISLPVAAGGNQPTTARLIIKQLV
jgi:hypothetical protein